MYLAFGIIFLLLTVLMASTIIITVVRSIKSGGGDMITKKNMFYLAPAFLIIYFLYVIAAAYSGQSFDFFYCFSLISAVLDVFKFEVKIEMLSTLCQAYPVYYADFVLAFFIAVLTAVLSVTSFFSRRFSNYVTVRMRLSKNCDIVVGDSADAVKYVKNTKNSILLGINITGQRYSDLLKQGVPVLKTSFEAKRLSRKLKKGIYNVIVFRDGKYPYTKIIDAFNALKANESLKIYLEANQLEMKILKEKFISKANKNLYVTGFSKYELMARRFVVDYPITKYIPRSFYKENYALKSNKQINIVFIGFGKVNYQLFRMCSMQFQFAQEKDGKLASKPVNYYIYDTENSALHNEFFSRILYEFDEEFKACDFPKPEKICEINIRPVDINSIEAKKEFKTLVTENSYTYFVVSLDNDLADASYAQTVRRLFKNNENYRIFVRAKNVNGEKLNEINDCITYFGEEEKLYSHENIINDDLIELAQRINILYNTIANPPEWLKSIKEDESLTPEEQRVLLNESLANPEHKKFMLEKWIELPYIEQDSNLYHALNLPFKLNLLGFDMVKKKDERDSGISESVFNQRYKNSGSKDDYGDYSFFFKTESSNVLAYIEHSRWNALYILYDYKQMKKADMQVIEKRDKTGKTEKVMPHKNTELKQHACITTYYGLNDLIEYKYGVIYPGEVLSEDNYKGNARLQKLSKIYAYDYMDLDRLYSEIIAMGYKLVYSNGDDK